MASDNSTSRIISGASASSSTWSRILMSSLKVAVETFDGTGHFGMWQGEVMDSLFQQGLDIAIEEKKPDDIEEKEWSTINRLACGTIRSCLSKEQKYAFKNETSAWKLWKALEGKFLKKSGQNTPEKLITEFSQFYLISEHRSSDLLFQNLEFKASIVYFYKPTIVEIGGLILNPTLVVLGVVGLLESYK